MPSAQLSPSSPVSQTSVIQTIRSSTESAASIVGGPPAQVTVSYVPSLRGYQGFEASSEYCNPSTWNFTLTQQSTGFVSYEYNVTKGINLFLRNLNDSWIIQSSVGGNTVSAEISGSTVTMVNSLQVNITAYTYRLPVQLSTANYTTEGNIVNVAWSVQGLITGTYQIMSPDLPWLTVNVVSDSSLITTTSTLLENSCDGGSVNY
jgi:hypothetical protein